MNRELWLSHADDSRPQIDLQCKIWNELKWEPDAETDDVVVDVADFVATLSGSVPSYRAKMAIQRAAERVPGIREVHNRLVVLLAASDTRADSVLAAAVANALVWDIRVPHSTLTERVVDGWVTLGGVVDRYSARLAAEQTVENLTGIRGLTNDIVVDSGRPSTDLRQLAEAALEHAALRGARISVTAQDRTVALRGSVHSLADRSAAERAVWDVAGVAAVDDLVTVKS